MGAHYCTNGGTQRAARGVAPCRHTAAATHRCPPLPSAAHFHAHAMPQLYSSIRSWAVTPFSFAAKMPASPSNCREPWPPKPKQRVRPELRHVAHLANLDEKVHKPQVNLKRLGLYKGAKIQFVSYAFEYFYRCIMTLWGLRDSKRPILMHKVHLKINDINPERKFVNLFSEFSPLCVVVLRHQTLNTTLLICSLFFTPFLQVIAAEGEQKASRALKEASEVISESSSALQLRYLQVRYPLALQRPPVRRRPRSDGRQARLVCRIGRMKGLLISHVIHVFLWLLKPLSPRHITIFLTLMGQHNFFINAMTLPMFDLCILWLIKLLSPSQITIFLTIVGQNQFFSQKKNVDVIC